MDLHKWMIETSGLEQQLAQAKQHNERVKALAASLGEDAPEDIVERVMNAVSTGIAKSYTKSGKPRKQRARKAEMAVLADAILKVMDKEGQTAAQIAAKLGPLWSRNALTKLLREKTIRVVSRGRYALP
jgi:hypothetical protein